MERPFARWKVIGVAGLVVAASVLSICQLTTGCLLPGFRVDEPSGRNQAGAAGPTADAATSDLNTKGAHDMFNLGSRSLSNRSIEHASSASFATQVLQSDVPVLVDFYADWCGPCRMLAPTLEQLAAELTDAKIVKVNVDHNPELAMQYGIESIPSLLVFKNGQVAAQHVGLAGKDRLRAMLER
jgi:thioredoxin 1